MSNRMRSEGRVDPAWLIAVVANCLEVPEQEIDPRVPLVRYGLDSVAAVELTTTVAEKLGCAVPDDLLLGYPDVRSLAYYMKAVRGSVRPVATAATHDVPTRDRMLADSILPPDVRPPRGSATLQEARAILVSGATGFLGAYLLRGLLRETTARIYCLVRPTGQGDLHERLRRNLESYGIWEASFGPRVQAVAADLLCPALGLTADRFAALAREIDEVYHCAAAVNWVLPYEGLRAVNVGGTLELLRLACRHKPKPFHFLSTLGVCYSTTAPAAVNEREDMLPYRDGLHLGYAQSKCVAEALVRHAARRGLPVTIHRPSLITGDSRSGVSNPDDLLSLLVRGCVRMGCAPDLDWVLDACPVDHVAAAVVALSRGRRRRRVFHLSNTRPPHWREAVLWLNLFGYPLPLVPYRLWRARLEEESRAPDHPLHLLRGFFLKPVAEGSLTLPEVLQEGKRPRPCATRTREILSQLSLECPVLDSRLLDRYFRSLIGRGILPPVACPPMRTGDAAFERLDAEFFGGVLRRFYHDDSLRIRNVVPLPTAPDHSLLTELTSWRHGSAAGLSRYRLDIEAGVETAPEALEVFVKVKPRDEEVIEVGARVAAACGKELGEAFARFGHRTGLAGCHLRELALYEHPDARLRRHTPAALGTVRDDERRRWILVLESLSGVALLNSAEDARGWRRPHIEAVLRGIAEVHAVWYGRTAELAGQPWLGHTHSAAGMAEMRELWNSLADHSARYFSDWVGSDVHQIQRRLIAGVGRWWQELEEMPRTLIHNDFNPRNLALRKTGEGLRLCAYDWELATLGVPQHDLAEFLCFVLTPECSRDDMLHYLEVHRRALARATGCPPNPGSWRRGFELSLCDLVVNRFPLYCLAHTFRPLRFLERVLRTWRRLYGHVWPEAGAKPQAAAKS